MAPFQKFQSLFYWNGLLRFAAPGAARTDWSVSILVLLEWSSEVIFLDEVDLLDQEFQSLFYWNGLLRPHISRVPPNLPLCFNPCSIGMVF